MSRREKASPVPSSLGIAKRPRISSALRIVATLPAATLPRRATRHATRHATRRWIAAPLLAAAWILGIACGGDSAGELGSLEWPQWRGPDRAAVSNESPLPVTWSPTSPNLRWTAELPGVGNSAPIVAAGRVYATTAYPVDEARPEGEHWRALLAFDASSGEALWGAEVFAGPAEKRHWLNTLAGPTPIADGERIYVYFGSVLAAVDTDGAVVWQREIDPRYAELSRYGAASSPAIAGELLIVAQDKEFAETEDVGWVAAFDRATGKPVWRTEWEHTCCSYSSPLVVERGGRREILFAHSGEVAGYDAESGDKLWSHLYPMLQMVSTPVVDGVIDGDYLAILGGADHNRGNVALRLSGSGSGTEVETLWESEKLAPQASSPVLYQGLLYNITTQGVLVVYEPTSGEILAQVRLPRGRNHASLVAGDGKVYASSSSGAVTVASAGRAPQILATNEVGERGTTASPAIGAGCFVQRTEGHLWCIEATSQESADS
ncbi:MAG TPA: PQQ-binding-like beta-propeller repeat protein [Thermoanaerobaculia bacterium]|nr:PQQ-binding-like beta-propeller repeat protein [Thermoanaerobaculia bacterium]